MTFGKRFCEAVGVVALGALVSTSAIAQVTTRLVTAGGAATSTKIIPGGTASIDVRVDAPATPTIGTAFRLSQTAPAANGFFSITARSFVGSPYNDAASGTADAVVLAPASALLDPDNNDNLGRSTVGLVATPGANNILAANLTLTASGATPLGTYTIKPTAGVSFVTGDGPTFTDYDMSGATYTIIVGQTLTVTKSGTGTGTVTSDIGAINCGATCSDIYPGSVVTLTAAPSAGSTFVGWSGSGCSGTGTCVVTVNAAKSVNAQFDLSPSTLTVTLAGTGTGVVTSVPAGINCPGTCAAPFAPASTVTLTAVANAGSTFSGWSGAGCSGTGTCVVTMSGAQAVTATFILPQVTLTVTKTGNGTGTVTSAPAGINCGATCSFGFASGTVVTLTATPGAGQNFTGWAGGGCSGVGTCVVTLNAATTVTATFTDTIPPDTTITGMPTNPSNVANPTFTFTSTEAGSTFQCSLDAAPFSACSSPTTVTVANGVHTFQVRAIDPAGNVDPTPASFTWTVAGVVAVAITPIPTLSEWMLVLLALLVGSAGILARRRKN